MRYNILVFAYNFQKRKTWNLAIILIQNNNTYGFGNFLFIKQKHIHSKFIFILRNIIDVISFYFRGRRYLYKQKNPYTSLFVSSYNFKYNNPLLLFASRIYHGHLYPIVLMKIINKTTEEINKFFKNISRLNKTDYKKIEYDYEREEGNFN